MNTQMTALRSKWHGVIWALLATNLFAACSYLQRKDAAKETRLPPSFTTGRIRIGMTLREAATTFPERKPEWTQPRTMGFQFTQTAKELSERTGVIPIPVGTFVDEKLVYVLSLVAYKGRPMKPEGIDLIHDAMLKECEALYGVEHAPPVVHKNEATGNEYSQIIWNNAAYKATLSLPRITNHITFQKIAALELVAVERKETAGSRGVDLVRTLFGVSDGKHERN